MTKFRKYGILLTVILAALMVCGSAWAADATDEATLRTALSGGAAKLQSGITVSDVIAVTNTATLDLNGYTLEISDDVKDSKSILSIGNEGKLIITDTSPNANGAIKSKATNRDMAFALYIHDGGTVALEKGTIQTTAKGEPIRIFGNVTSGTINNNPIYSSFTMNGGKVIGGQWVIRPYGNGATVTINGGEVTNNATYDDYCTIQGLGTIGYGGTVINITGGKLVGGTNGAAIYHPQDGKLTISGGTLSGYDGVQFKSGTLNMTGGTINATGTKPSSYPDSSNGSVTTASAISLVSNSDYTGNINIKISGASKLESANACGIFTQVTKGGTTKVTSIEVAGGTISGGDKALLLNDWSEISGDVKITGGTYNSDPTSYVTDPKYVVKSEGGKYIVKLAGVTVTPETKSIVAGSTAALVASSDISETFAWTSDKPAVATVNGGVVTAVSAGTAVITATGGTSGKSATCTVTVLAKPVTPEAPKLPEGTPDNVKPVEPAIKQIEPDATPTEKAEAINDALTSAEVNAGTITTADLEVSAQGVVVPKESVVKAAAVEAAKEPGKTVTVKEVIALPVFTANLATSGDVAAIAYPVKGADLKAAKAGDVKVLKVLSATTGAFFTFEGDSASTDDKEYALQMSGDKKFLAADATIDAAKDYSLLLFIKDNGDFDLCSKNGKVVDPAAIVQTETADQPKNGSSGCSAGFAGLALLAFVPMVLRRKK